MRERMSQFVVQQNRAEATAYMPENRVFIAATRSPPSGLAQSLLLHLKVQMKALL